MVVLPIPIKAVYIRINPTNWRKCIALRVEFYGCELGQQPTSPGMSPFSLLSLNVNIEIFNSCLGYTLQYYLREFEKYQLNIILSGVITYA